MLVDCKNSTEEQDKQDKEKEEKLAEQTKHNENPNT